MKSNISTKSNEEILKAYWEMDREVDDGDKECLELMDLAREEAMKDILTYIGRSHSAIEDFKNKKIRGGFS